MLRRVLGAGGVTAVALIGLFGGVAVATEGDLEELRDLTIEQLANVEVTSVSRRPEALSRAPASIEVISAEDIRRSGAQSLPEVLRLARNLEVARVNSQTYAISARGFNSFEASNKLLVLVDGRSIYTPLYSGVFWDQHDVPLQDIERIEVISGPGGTLWGANAVNGVINIITRSARDTQGFSADAFLGSVDNRLDLRYGAALGDNGAVRLFATGFERDEMLRASGEGAADGWNGAQIGFRADWGTVRSGFMLEGAVFQNAIDAGGSHEGGHLLGRWRQLMADGSSIEAQAYYSSADRETAFTGAAGVSDALATTDVSVQHNFRFGQAHQIVWGAGYRRSESEFNNTLNPFTFLQPQRTLQSSNVFVQDEIALRPDLSLTLGVKLEDHTFTDLEYMPNARIAWRPNDRVMWWAAVSRAVRTPSRIDYELQFPGVIIPGTFISEELTAYELGYRAQPTANASVSATLYYHDYDNLRTSSLGPGGTFPARIGNDLEGEVYGLELWGDLGVSPDWRLSAGLTLLQQDFRTRPFASDVNGSGQDPAYQVFIRSHANIRRDLTLDLDLRAIEEIAPQVPSYVELDGRLGWRVSPRLELALIGENLLDEAHPESINDPPFVQARRSVTLGARVTY